MTIPSNYLIADALRDNLMNNSEIERYLNVRSKTIKVNPYANVDPNKAPWIGVYVRTNTIEANALPRNFKGSIALSIVSQASSTDSCTCAEKLMNLVAHIEQTIIDDLKLKTTVDLITSIDTQYTYLETERENMYFQMAITNLTAEVRANAR